MNKNQMKKWYQIEYFIILWLLAINIYSFLSNQDVLVFNKIAFFGINMFLFVLTTGYIIYARKNIHLRIGNC